MKHGPFFGKKKKKKEKGLHEETPSSLHSQCGGLVIEKGGGGDGGGSQGREIVCARSRYRDSRSRPNSLPDGDGRALRVVRIEHGCAPAQFAGRFVQLIVLSKPNIRAIGGILGAVGTVHRYSITGPW